MLNVNFNVIIMPNATDEMPDALLSEVMLCEISDVRRTRRREWAKRKHVRRAHNRGRYGEADAVEMVAFRVLVAQLGYEDAALAWSGVRPSLAGASLNDQLLAVINLQLKTGAVVKNAHEIGDLVLKDHPFRVVQLTDAVREVRLVYRRIRDARAQRQVPSPT